MQRIAMRRRTQHGPRVLSALVAAAALLVAPAWAEEEEQSFEIEDTDYGDDQRYGELTRFGSEIELGFLYNSGEELIFGDYGGLLDDPFFVLGNLDIRARDLFGWGDDHYARLRGLNLGLDSRFIDAEYGRQGLFGLRFEYDQLPAVHSETSRTFFSGVGGEQLTLPVPWTPGANGGEMTELAANLRRIDIDHERRRYSGGASLVLPANLDFDISYDYENKEGRRLSGSMIGLTGGNPRAVVIPAPVAYVTQQVEAALRYTGDNVQASLGYYGSFFNDENRFLAWENPYTAVGAWDPTAGYNDGTLAECVGVSGCGMGRKGLPPDNYFNQFLAQGGIDLPYRTRVTLNTAFGWMHQDDDLLPYSVNPQLDAMIPGGGLTDGTDLAALPRRSLDAEIFNTLVDFRVASRPLEKLSLDLRYRFDDRDNDTPQDNWVRIRADAEDQAAADSGQARLNLPYSFTQHEVEAGVGYRIWRRTNLSLGYEWELTNRDFQEVDEVMDHILKAGLTSRPWSFLSTRLNYSRSWRRAEDYRANAPFIEGHAMAVVDADRTACLTSGVVPPELCPFENHPLVRKYYLASRDRDDVRLQLSVVPHEDVTIGISANYVHEDYDDTEVGVTDVMHVSPGFDLAWTPIERLRTHAFYSYQWYKTKQNGWSFVGFDPDGPGPQGGPFSQISDPLRRWSSSDTDETHTVGAGFDVSILPNKFDVGVDYLFSQTDGQIDFALGSRLAAGVPYPSNRSRQHNVSVHGDYRFTDNISMRAGYLYADFNRTDWALDGIGPTSLSCSANACVIGSGRDAEDYRAHVVSWSLAYTFW